MPGNNLKNRISKAAKPKARPGHGGKRNITPPNNKPEAPKKKNKKKGSDGKKNPSKEKANNVPSSLPQRPKFEFKSLSTDENLGDRMDQVDRIGADVVPEKSTSNYDTATPAPTDTGDGFISLDMDDMDDTRSIHTTTFKAFEDSLPPPEEEEEEEDYVAVSTGKRKRNEGDDGRPSVAAEYPWVREVDSQTQRQLADWLTKEIKDFVAYMSPSAEEIEGRNAAVRRVRDLVESIWKDAGAHVFGSYATDLYLPGSDIDMVVISKSGRLSDRKSLYQLSSRLRSSGVAKSMEVIAKTRVPIIKFVDTQTNIHIDISFERQNGVHAVDTIQSWTRLFPSLRYFVFVVKQFLSKRKLNEVHTGGLGGFSVICMVVSFLHNHPRVSCNDVNVEDNLGVLLLEFFELYGKHFNYDDVALCMSGSMDYKLKRHNPHLQGQNQFSLAIEDPNDATNNLSRGSFNIHGIKKAFGGAYDLLADRCYELEYTPVKQRKGASVLGPLIRLKGPLRDFEDDRNVVRNEARDVKTTKQDSTAPPPAKIQRGSPPKPEVVYISDQEDEESSHDEKPRQDETITIGSSHAESDDSDDNPVAGDDDDDDDDNDEANSRVNATTLDKQKKKQYWLEKSGVVAV